MNAPCANCASDEGRAVSFDLDLPTIVLCPMCSFLIVSDRAVFDEMGRTGKRKAARKHQQEVRDGR